MSMEELKEEIREKLNHLHHANEFAHVINELGFELMDEGKLDSDELIWEVAREIWGDRGLDMEQEVQQELEKLL